MPIYEFRCTDCEHRFSQLFRSISAASEAGPPCCPSCGGVAVERLVSSVAVHFGRTSSTGEGAAETTSGSKEVFGEKELKRALDDRGY